MGNDRLLTITSVLAIVLASFHLSDDVVRGFEPGGLKNMGGITILLVWLCGTLLLRGRRFGYVILIFGSLLATVMPVTHMMGKGLGGAVAASGGSLFFIWTLFALGVTGMFALMLSIDGLWRLRRGKPAA